MEDMLVVEVKADTDAFEKKMEDLKKKSNAFAGVITSALQSAATQGASFQDVLKSIGNELSKMALQSAMEPLQDLLSGAFMSFANPSQKKPAFAKGGIFSGASDLLSAGGGAIGDGPAMFRHAGQIGTIGERGPEAIMPLRRGADGKLGVAASATSSPANIVFNVSANDAESFRRSEAQISAMLTRAVGRGRRSL